MVGSVFFQTGTPPERVIEGILSHEGDSGPGRLKDGLGSSLWHVSHSDASPFLSEVENQIPPRRSCSSL